MLKLFIYLVFKKPKASDRRAPGDLILELLEIPNCVKKASIFTLKLITMSTSRTIPELEPTQDELWKIQNEFSHLSVA